MHATYENATANGSNEFVRDINNITNRESNGIFDFMEISVFTEVTGVVTFEGTPVSGVKVVQYAEVDFNGNKFNSEALTDDQGRFRFDAIHARTMNTFLPSANMVSQLITIQYHGKQYDAWRSVKDNYDYDGEVNDIKALIGENNRMRVFPNKITDKDKPENIIPINLICELTNDDTEIKLLGVNTVVGLCQLTN